MTEDNKNEKLMDDLEPHVALANAIVMQACKDYRKTYRLHIRTYRVGDKNDMQEDQEDTHQIFENFN